MNILKFLLYRTTLDDRCCIAGMAIMIAVPFMGNFILNNPAVVVGKDEDERTEQVWRRKHEEEEDKERIEGITLAKLLNNQPQYAY